MLVHPSSGVSFPLCFAAFLHTPVPVHAWSYIMLVSLYNQWSSVIHMHMDPLCVHCSPVFPPTLPCFYCIYYIIATSALLPICVGAHGGVSRIYQSWQQASLRAGWKLLDEWGTKPLFNFSDAVVNLFKLHQDSWTEIRKMEVVQKDNL